MREVHDGLFVGGELECRQADEGWATVHACRTACREAAVGYPVDPAPDSPLELAYEEPDDLYLCMTDLPGMLSDPILLGQFLEFVEGARDEGRPVLIHCDQGISRAPTLAMLYLSKSADVLSDGSFEDAAAQYRERDPRYRPDRGIRLYLGECWDSL